MTSDQHDDEREMRELSDPANMDADQLAGWREAWEGDIPFYSDLVRPLTPGESQEQVERIPRRDKNFRGVQERFPRTSP